MTKPRTLLLAILGLILLSINPLQAQEQKYDFINYNANHLRYDSTSRTMRTFFARWHRMATTKQGNINIVHIGGSHVQAGYMTETIRLRMLATTPQMVGPRGMIFP